MSDNRISPDLFSVAGDALGRTAARRPSVVARVVARLRADKFDHQLAVGVPAPAGSALAVHQARLTSTAERESIARSLREALRDSHTGAVFSSRIPVHPRNIAAAEELIDAITLRLHSPRPGVRVEWHGCDGCSPTAADPSTGTAKVTWAVGSARHSLRSRCDGRSAVVATSQIPVHNDTKGMGAQMPTEKYGVGSPFHAGGGGGGGGGSGAGTQLFDGPS
jgi:hypothetical protein